MAGDIRIAVDGRGVAEIVIDHATRLNTLNAALMGDLIDAVQALGTHPDLRVAVLRGAGERAFIGGADIDEMAALDPPAARDFITRVHRCCDVFRRLPVPVIARLAGFTLGAGLEVAAACDLRIAAANAHFAMPEVLIGIPSVVEAALLPGLIGQGRANRLLLTGETIDAATAAAWGLVEEVAAPEALDGAVAALVDKLLAAGPGAVRAQKALLADWQARGVEAGIAASIDIFAASFTTPEPGHMMAAFRAADAARKAARKTAAKP